MENGITEGAAGLGWLDLLRSGARETLDLLGPPRSREELWRFTDLEQFRLERYAPPQPGAGAAPAPEALEQATALAGPPPAGRIVHADGAALEIELGDEARRAGVIFTSLEQAASTYPDLLREHLGRLHGASDYHSAGSLASLRGGSLLFVPAGVELSAPLLSLNWVGAAGAAVALRTVVIVERDARVTLAEVHASASLDSPTLCFPATELYVGPGAEVRHAAFQQLDAGARHLSHVRARVEQDARLDTLTVTLGGHTSRAWTEVELAGPGAESRLLGASFLDGEQRAEHWTVQDHAAPNTSSDLLFASAAADSSLALFNGTIKVRPGARGTSAYQSSRNLLLSDRARAHTNPQLEIDNDDVRCTHGATVGPLEEEQLFYLMARGIPRAEAERILVLGFFDRVVRGGEWSGLHERLTSAIRHKLGA